MHGVRAFRSLLTAAVMVLGLAVAPTTAHAGSSYGGSDPRARRVCPEPSAPRRTACQAMVRTDLRPRRSIHPHGRPAGLSPQDLRNAYDLFGLHDNGRTVAITYAFHNPNLESDLAVCRRQFGLRPCTSANGCLRVINQNGGTTPPPGPRPHLGVRVVHRRGHGECGLSGLPHPGRRIQRRQGRSGWFVAGGTSVATPLIAAMYALAGNPAPGTYPNSCPYARPQVFNDITTGSNRPPRRHLPVHRRPGLRRPHRHRPPHGVNRLRN